MNRSKIIEVMARAYALSPMDGSLRERMSAALTAYKSHLHAEGLAVVPVEPTEAMLEAGSNKLVAYSDTSALSDAAEAWSAMIAASQEKDA